MKIEMRVLGDLAEAMRAEERAGRVAVRGGLEAAAQGLKTEWRRQVQAAGLGPRLARTVRAQTWPRQPSSNAASLVWSRAPELMEAFDKGVTIRSAQGFFLAIPTAAAGIRIGNKRITPGLWESMTGVRLRFVYVERGISMLVADNVRVSTRGRAVLDRRRTANRATTSVPIFLLLPQVRLRKRLDLATAARRWADAAPGLIVQSWPRT